MASVVSLVALTVLFSWQGALPSILAEEGQQITEVGDAVEAQSKGRGDGFLILGELNGTTERQLVQITFHNFKVKIIGSVKDENVYYFSRCLLAVDEENSKAFLLNTSSALQLDVNNGNIVGVYSSETVNTYGFAALFWNKTDQYSLQALYTYRPPELNVTETCWAKLVTDGVNKTYRAECTATLPGNEEFPVPCVFQLDEGEKFLWYLKATYTSGEQLLVTGVERDPAHGQVTLAWAGTLGNGTLDSRLVCFARDSQLKKTYGVILTNTSQKLVEVLPAKLPLVPGQALPPPEHLINLPAGLRLHSNGACSYNVTQHRLNLLMRGTLDIGAREDDAIVLDRYNFSNRALHSFYHWFVMVSMKTLAIELVPLDGLTDNFIGLQMLSISNGPE